LKLKKKLSSKELADSKDEFVTFTEKSLRFIKAHRTAFALSGGVVVIAFVSFLVVRSYLKTREEDAALEFGKAYSYYQVKVHQRAESGDTPLTVVYANALQQFEGVINKYENTKAGKMAMLYAAECAYWGQQYDKAISYYQEFLTRLKDDDSFKQLAWSGLGYSYEAKGDCNRALEYFQKIVDANGIEKVYAYYNMNQCYEKLKDNQKAQQMQERIKKEFPDSLMAQWIDAKSGKPASPEQKNESEERKK
jgi:tetratricopeptide (TPR) repeat protein